ncbi:unnamed protein product [Gulo gulo]|uniref:Uncharacterized protein n=1 Tax=Gulo gulo TaxID=48420 RepID=A0A9X9LJU9_GULGU|nr:unnamed protein product [Gulo gulo]
MSAMRKPCTVPSKGWTVSSTWPPMECLVLRSLCPSAGPKAHLHQHRQRRLRREAHRTG